MPSRLWDNPGQRISGLREISHQICSPLKSASLPDSIIPIATYIPYAKIISQQEDKVWPCDGGRLCEWCLQKQTKNQGCNQGWPETQKRERRQWPGHSSLHLHVARDPPTWAWLQTTLCADTEGVLSVYHLPRLMQWRGKSQDHNFKISFPDCFQVSCEQSHMGIYMQQMAYKWFCFMALVVYKELFWEAENGISFLWHSFCLDWGLRVVKKLITRKKQTKITLWNKQAALL